MNNNNHRIETYSRLTLRSQTNYNVAGITTTDILIQLLELPSTLSFFSYT